ncbi:PAS domain S-box protein [Halorussus salinisoli]|uniref:PAS domain S-box protein n=1 Tax=Halorussus salinisoli TaxID=2558242 RepID=UPI0010C1DC23|nr:PAS domain S-box protein [Halorussus salinisoli]
MGTSGPSKHTLDEILTVFTRDTSGTPLTTSEVADELDATRRVAASNLEELADRGKLGTRTVGANERIWWRPTEQPQTTPDGDESRIERVQFDEFVGAVTDYAIFVLDPDGYVQTWNEGARQLKGYEKDEIVGQHFSTFYTEADREAGVPDRNLAIAADDGRVEDEGWRVQKDGSRFWANITLTSLYDGDDLQGFLKVTRDMTERHEYEQRLREQKERFETLVREVKDYAIFLLDTDGIVQTWNEGARQLKGYDDDEIIGEHFSTFYTEADKEVGRPEQNLEKAHENGRVEDEGERVRKDGSTFWANVIITALHDDDGDLRGFAKVTRDMTERHEYEQRLRDQRDELDELNQINAVIRDIDQVLVSATSREEVEQAVCDRLAASEPFSAAWTAEYTADYEEVTPRASASIDEAYLDAIRTADADTAERTEKGVGATALETGTPQPVQRLQTDCGGEPWREASLAAGYGSALTVPLVYNEAEYGILTVYADSESAFDERKIAVMSELGETISHTISAIRRKEREQTLTALQESTRRLLNTETETEIGDIIVETLTDDAALSDAVVYRFDAAESALEPVSSSFEAESDTNRLASLSAGADSPVWRSFQEGKTQFTESITPETVTGDRRTMLVPLGSYGVLAVTEADQETFEMNAQDLVQLVAATAEAALKRTERERRLQRQNERLDKFASMLAHELRNPVNIGQIYSRQLPNETYPEAVEYVTEAFDRIEEMIDVMLVLTRGREAVGERTPVELGDVAHDAWDDVDAPDAALEVAIDDTIHADKTYVHHLFRNLFDNAVEHGGSDVTVTVGELSTGFYVADDGVGIPPDERETVFREGYTTASETGGTGLGLAFVKELAEVYGWDCQVTESDAGGAQFEFENVTTTESGTD